MGEIPIPEEVLREQRGTDRVGDTLKQGTGAEIEGVKDGSLREGDELSYTTRAGNEIDVRVKGGSEDPVDKKGLQFEHIPKEGEEKLPDFAITGRQTEQGQSGVSQSEGTPIDSTGSGSVEQPVDSVKSSEFPNTENFGHKATDAELDKFHKGFGSGNDDYESLQRQAEAVQIEGLKGEIAQMPENNVGRQATPDDASQFYKGLASQDDDKLQVERQIGGVEPPNQDENQDENLSLAA